jgi:hypothetical protein
MRKSNKKPTLSHSDISKALQKFKKQGGLIHKLPDQIVPKGVLVGGKFGVYETVFGDRGTASASSAASLEAAAE